MKFYRISSLFIMLKATKKVILHHNLLINNLYNDTMNYLFPEIEQQNTRTLIVIGNGFDLASGIQSSYSHFKQWLKQNKKNRLIGLMDTFFSNQRDIWGDIEKALGEYDEDNILEYCRPDEKIDYDHLTRSIAAVEDGPDWIFKPILDEFTEAFKDWVDSIDITKAEKACELPVEGKYLTFNYTETLEKIYGIPETNILHIHGSRLTDKEYVIGHDNFRDPDEAYNDESQMLFMQQTWSKIIEWMNGLVKDSASMMRINQAFFDGLSGIEQVVVYGHSFYEVDWPYLEEIVKQIGKDKSWSISYHEPKDLKQIESFVQKVDLKNVKTFNW